MLGTVKSLELVGLATLNIMVTAVLSLTFFGNGGATGSSYSKLTETNINAFVNQMTEISSGQQNGNDLMTINKFLQDHIGADSVFKTTIAYDLPNMNSGDRQITMTKRDYINNILSGLRKHRPDEAGTQVENIDIAPDSRHARIVTTSYERGPMPVQSESGQEIIQVKGISYCEQNLSLVGQTITVAEAVCNTSVKPAEND